MHIYIPCIYSMINNNYTSDKRVNQFQEKMKETRSLCMIHYTSVSRTFCLQSIDCSVFVLSSDSPDWNGFFQKAPSRGDFRIHHLQCKRPEWDLGKPATDIIAHTFLIKLSKVTTGNSVSVLPRFLAEPTPPEALLVLFISIILLECNRQRFSKGHGPI